MNRVLSILSLLVVFLNISCGAADNCDTDPGFDCKDGNLYDLKTSLWATVDSGIDANTSLSFSVWVWPNDITNPDQGVVVGPTPNVSDRSQTSMRVSFTGATNKLTVKALNGTGTVGVLDDDTYECDGECPVVLARNWYKLTFTADVPTSKYSVTLEDCLTQTQTVLATNFSFSTDSEEVNSPLSLRYYGLWGSGGNIRLKNGDWQAEFDCTPIADCSEEPAWECGSRPDGCNGLPLDCGGCQTEGDVCLSGVCCSPATPATVCSAGGYECGSWDNGCGGTVSCGTCSGNTPLCNTQTGKCEAAPAGRVFFKDNISGSSEPWGFDEALTERPVGSFLTSSKRSDTTVNLAKVTTAPCGAGAAACIKQAGKLSSAGGIRSELGIWTLGGQYPAMKTHLRTPDGTNGHTYKPIYLSQEIFVPEHVQPSPPDDIPWLAFGDIHPTAGGVWRPGTGYLAPEDGSNNMLFTRKDRDIETYATKPYPIGEWFCFEMEWSGGPRETLRAWIDSELAYQEANIKTTPNGSPITELELYLKMYTEPQGSRWTPDLAVWYRRNIKITDYRSGCN